MNQIKDVVIVGGGTAGLIAALYFKKYFPQFNVKIVKSEKVGIIGVGEGTTNHWDLFMHEIGLDPLEVINKTNATLKAGILFNDWNYKSHQYFHSVFFPETPDKYGFLGAYNTAILNHSSPFILSYPFEKIYFKNQVKVVDNLLPITQYHFDTFKLNNYLLSICKQRGILIENHFVTDIIQDDRGNISSLITDQNYQIKGDFFIDCSGLKRILSSKLNNKFISYTPFLPVNSAITIPTPITPNKPLEPYTISTSLSSGWAWRIPTQTQYGNGYVFSDQYINSDHALNEFNKHLGTNVEKVAKNIKFEAGKVNKFFIKNCVSIGLAGSFSEPLEAQSIGFSIIQSKLLCENFVPWQLDPNRFSKIYNRIMDKSFENIVDYIQIHYLNQRNDTKFWKDKPFELTNFNKETIERFKKGIFSYFDFDYPYIMFSFYNFYQVYYGLGLITRKNILKMIENVPLFIRNKWYESYKNHFLLPLPKSISHIDYLKLIKENYSS